VEQHQKNAAKGERRARLQNAARQIKRNVKSRPASRKSWKLDDLDEGHVDTYERIMPRDEGDRRRARERAAFRPSNESNMLSTAPPVEGVHARVIEIGPGLCRVDLEGRSLLCQIPGSFAAQEIEFTNAVAVGDEVIIAEDGAGGGVVRAVLPRRNILARPQRGALRQIVVANADQLLIVAAWREPIIWLELIDRYLIAAERSGLRPIICVNKIDLVEDELVFDETLQPYRRLGYRLIPTSVINGSGIEELREALRDRTTVIAGLSGVGKSSLLAQVQPGLQLRVGAVSEWWSQGRHTTTSARLYQLPIGGAVVDTPGIREFGLAGLRQGELAELFGELAPLLGACRFRDCAHLAEAGCAIRDAVERGSIARSRYHSYRQIRQSLPA
jgi:ribosome biogenesis GTPase / thiamine phosphate phosphatase